MPMARHAATRNHSPIVHHSQNQATVNGNGVLHSPVHSHGSPSHIAPHMASMNGTVAAPAGSTSSPNEWMHKLAQANEQTWLLIGQVAEQMGDLEHALSAYENALRHNAMSPAALNHVAGIARMKENYPKAVEYFQRVLRLNEENGEVWGALGHCYLMQDDLQKAYSAYQQALYLLPAPKEDPKLWYGIGILYDRYGSLDHAEDAFNLVLKMNKGNDPDFDKENEIRFRLGIIYKQQNKYTKSLDCFQQILRLPPSPLAHADIYFQIGHVHEQQKDYLAAKEAYERVVEDNPRHAKVLQQLGWLYHQEGSAFQNQELAIQYLTKSLEADPSDAQSWYLLGRAYMAGQKYNKAYEAYQQAVYRDGRNPTFWCSIGVLYFQINQFRDALDAYSRAIRINPYISEVWYDLGSLYESCNNQISDAIDAYARASELDPTNRTIADRLQLLRNAQITGTPVPAAPGPQDVHPTAYASASLPPTNAFTGPPLQMHSPDSRSSAFREMSGRSPISSAPLAPVSANSGERFTPRPFRGGSPPPVILDDSRHPLPGAMGFAPMDVDPPTSQQRSLLLNQPGPGSSVHWDRRHFDRNRYNESDGPHVNSRTPQFHYDPVSQRGSPPNALPDRHNSVKRYDPARHDVREVVEPPELSHRQETWSRSGSPRGIPPHQAPLEVIKEVKPRRGIVKQDESEPAPKKERKRRAPAASKRAPKEDHSKSRSSIKGTPEPAVPSTSTSRSPLHVSPPKRVVDENYDEGVAETLAEFAGSLQRDNRVEMTSRASAATRILTDPAPSSSTRRAQVDSVSSNGPLSPSPSVAPHYEPLPLHPSSTQEVPLKRSLTPGYESPKPKRAKSSDSSIEMGVSHAAIASALSTSSLLSQQNGHSRSPPLPISLPPHPRPIGSGVNPSTSSSSSAAAAVAPPPPPPPPPPQTLVATIDNVPPVRKSSPPITPEAARTGDTAVAAPSASPEAHHVSS